MPSKLEIFLSNFFDANVAIRKIEEYKIKCVLSSIKFGNFFLKTLNRLLFKKKISKQPKKILIFRTGSIGDIICSLPAIDNIKHNFPNAGIDVLTNAGSSNLVSIQALLSPTNYHSIIDYLGKSPQQLWNELKEEKYDLVIQLPQQFASVKNQIRDMFFFRTVGIKMGFGWQKSSSLLFKKTQEKYIVQKKTPLHLS